MRRFVIGCLVTGLGLAAGCSSDKDKPSTQTVVVTNVVNGVPVVVTNVVAAAEAERLAPQLISPNQNAEFEAILHGSRIKIDFEWAPVPGASGYTLRMGHFAGGHRVGRPSISIELPVGSYTWWIEPVFSVGDGTVEPGPASERRNFTIKQGTVQVISPR